MKYGMFLAAILVCACEPPLDGKADATAQKAQLPSFIDVSECIMLSTRDMDFGVAVAETGESSQTLILQNTCGVVLEGNIWFDYYGQEFVLPEEYDKVITLGIDEIKFVLVTFVPKRRYGMDEGSGTTQSRDALLHLHLWPSTLVYWNDEIEALNNNFEVKVHGLAFEPRCPQPVITTIVEQWPDWVKYQWVWYDNLLIIGQWDNLVLSAEKSYGYNGEIVSWHWIVVQAPEELTPQQREDLFLFDADDETIYSNLPNEVCGEYILGLEVEDTLRPSCAPALLHLKACGGMN